MFGARFSPHFATATSSSAFFISESIVVAAVFGKSRVTEYISFPF
jgi:hypothetical protein